MIWTEVLILLFCFNSWFTFETTPNNMLIYNTKPDAIALHYIRFLKILGMWAWCLPVLHRECGGSTAATPAAPSYLGPSDHHMFLQPVLGFLPGLDWEKGPVQITDKLLQFLLQSGGAQKPPVLVSRVWHITDQAANIKPVRLLLQWMNWALWDDCKAMLSVNVDPTERLSLLISIALISSDIPEGFFVPV